MRIRAEYIPGSGAGCRGLDGRRCSHFIARALGVSHAPPRGAKLREFLSAAPRREMADRFRATARAPVELKVPCSLKRGGCQGP